MPKMTRLSTFLPHSVSYSQHGASVTGVMFFILVIGVFIKIGIAIIPAQMSDRHLSKLIAHELSIANANQDSAQQFMRSLDQQLSINAYYDINPEEVIEFTDNSPGRLKVYKKYNVVNNLFGNVDIVNRFEGNITAENAAK